MAAAPYILARSLKEAHEFARGELGLPHGRYRVVNHPSTLKSVRGADLHLVPGYQNRFDRFAMKGALRWTRMNVIDHTEGVVGGAVEDDLEPAGEQLMIVSAEEAHSFLVDTSNGDNMVSEGGPVAPEPETDDVKRRRSRCKTCGTLHFKEDGCPSEVLPGV